MDLSTDNKSFSNFKKDGYLLLSQYFIENIDNLEEITKYFSKLPDTKNKFMKYYELSKNNKILSRMEYLLDFNNELKEIEKTIIKPLASLYFQEEAVLFKEKVNFKLPGGGAFAPHQDFPAWNDLPPKEYITIGIPLDNMTIKNGCLYMATGIARNREIYHNPSDNKISKHLIESWNWHPITCKRGDVLIFDSFVPHRSEVNTTQNSRRIYYFTYNKKSEGEHREGYFNKKRELFPQDVDKIPGKDYSVIGAKYNLGNPIDNKV